ncbi:uncharacterized protein B0J16DRAFT_375762 [Fusarium flagelliforme]|uniref:NAD(P)-binding domain-containing protein n=1 Tax=Fusarium flagelliforme TaxID=2675880 RepID=A0A395MGM2_9HYPO|nr:uncharacterized protein B0J16DRAFT_375762 [Fusarium flagelliforme]KAH7175053.1 hypothetical protein B0J16DRAFT_375762 [Fusarium flagelliforme]RFN46910.1 hypothetical protein FIE12Z_8843 [Fusarium flagelliforme]
MSDSLKSVAQAGASGNHGEAVLKELVEGGFDVSVLSRRSGQIPSGYASQVREVIVDYDDPESLKEALESVDAVVSTLGSPAVGGLSYIFIYSSLFQDLGLTNGSLANLKEKSVILYKGGDLRISVARRSTVGRGIVGVIKNPTATKNRSIRTQDGKISMKELASALLEALPSLWKITEVDTDKLKADSDEALKNGIKEKWVFFNYIFQGGNNAKYGCSFEKVDNDFVGLPKLSTEEMRALVMEITQANA